MLINNLKIAMRNMLRYKSFSLINIGGLTIGLTAFLAIGLYVADELSYDQFHEKKDRIHRAIIRADFDGQVEKWGAAPNKLGPAVAKDVPEVEKATRVFHHNFGQLAFVSTESEKLSETQLFFADREALDVFSFTFLKGSATDALTRPNTAIISESAAKRYFGDSDPVGKVLVVDNNTNLEVTAVYKDFPSNSFLQCKIIGSFTSGWFGQESNQSWGNASFDTYFLLHPGTSAKTVEEKIESLLAKNIPKDNRWFTIALQPLLDIRLHSGDLNSSFDRRLYGNMAQVKILIALALVILLIASVNYMNLTTAQSQRRNKEVGIAKTLGATFGQLSTKFYFEASLFVLISMLLSVMLFIFLMPFYNSVSGKILTTDFLMSGWFWLTFCTTWLFLALLSGLYPAVYLSSFKPQSALQNKASSGGQAMVRKGLVVFQFSVSVLLIICAVTFYNQMNFIRNKKLGYQPEQVVAIMVSGAKDRDQILAVKNAYENMTNVASVARAQSFPGKGTSMRNILREGAEGEGSSLLTLRATSEILNVLNIKLLAGSTLPQTKDPADTTVQVVINKSTLDYLGLTAEDVIGKRVSIQGFQGPTEVVGVTEDFHYQSLREKISPFCFHNAQTESFTYLLVKVNTGNLVETMTQLEQVFKKNIPSSFEYTFLDQNLSLLYSAEQNLASVVLIFAGLAIFVACLGLYALVAFTSELRSKEIGIRKVLGASVAQLVAMLSRDFILLVAIALPIGIPAGYYLMTQWLQGFAYKTEISTWIFLAAAGISIAIAWITVSFESYKVASSDPAKKLRTE